MFRCTECLVEKQMWEFYKHPLTKDWIMHRCKVCVLNGRRTEHELGMSRVRDEYRYYNNQKRRDYQINLDKMPKRRLLYVRWQKIINRCCKENDKNYSKYGGRGIEVCKDRMIFDNFYNDMYPSFIEFLSTYWRKNTTIDRIDNDGNYCKENCRWATYKQQAVNRRNTVIINWKPLMTWADELWMPYKLLYSRIHTHKWSFDRAISTPKKIHVHN